MRHIFESLKGSVSFSFAVERSVALVLCYAVVGMGVATVIKI